MKNKRGVRNRSHQFQLKSTFYIHIFVTKFLSTFEHIRMHEDRITRLKVETQNVCLVHVQRLIQSFDKRFRVIGSGGGRRGRISWPLIHAASPFLLTVTRKIQNKQMHARINPGSKEATYSSGENVFREKPLSISRGRARHHTIVLIIDVSTPATIYMCWNENRSPAGQRIVFCAD